MRPSDPSGLKLWLKASSESYSDGNAVGTATDRSGLGNDFTQVTAGNKPTFKTGIVNSKAVYRFDGGDFLAGPDFVSALTAGEVFIVVKIVTDPPTSASFGGASNPQGGIWDFGSVADGSHFPYTDGSIYEEFGTTARKDGIAVATLAQFRLYNVASAASDFKIRLDGTQIHTTATNTVGFTTAPVLGRSRYGDNTLFFLDGDIAEVFIYNAVLSATDRNLLGGYITTEYGLTIAGATFSRSLALPPRRATRRHLVNR